MGEFLHKEPCPVCGSRDNLARYDDGSATCFGQACKHWEPPDSRKQRGRQRMGKSSSLIGGEVLPLEKRHITEETAERYNYQVGKDKNGNTVQIANYYSEGRIVAQKLRYPNKDFKVIGEDTWRKNLPLFGEHLFKGGRQVIVTEGEIDCMTVSQLQGNKWPVVSLPNGVGGNPTKEFSRHVPFLERFEKVIFMLDQDEPGQAAVQMMAPMLTPGRAFVAHLPHKDPNECLQRGVGDAVIKAMWEASPYRPDGIVSIDDIWEEARSEPEMGLSWPWESLTKFTHGRRRGELYGFGAGVGVGKTEAFKECVEHIVTEGGQVGILFLEEHPAKTAKILAGKLANRRFHIPGGDWTQAELDEALGRLKGLVHLYNHFGAKDYETIRERIRFMVQHLGVYDIFLDHLTALVASAEDERRSLDWIMADLASLCQNLNFTLYFNSHLTTPDGKPHEEGGRVYERHFTGSRAICRWAHFLFALERDKQDPGSPTAFRILKDRFTGDSTGKVFFLSYDADRGRMEECDPPDAGEKEGFVPNDNADF